jgi:DNA mismatch repair ATPase MutS
MIQQTKIQFLPAEMELVSSPDIILTKNAILQKIKSFFEEVQMKQQDVLKKYSSQLPEEVLKISPKISRGENYKGLPWLVLDNPRHFQHNNIFAIRTMFWWGNFFSITLHLSGNNKNDLLKNLTRNISELAKNDFYIYNETKEWEHDIDHSSYIKLSAINKDELKKIFSANSFLKLAVKFTVESLEAVEDKLLRNYELLVKCCC